MQPKFKREGSAIEQALEDAFDNEFINEDFDEVEREYFGGY